LPLSQARLAYRRRRILATAQSLLHGRYNTSFSMGELARRAGVSPATPYNLIGTKAEILRLVVEDEYRRFSLKIPKRPKTGPLRALLDGIGLLVAHYESDRQFYRSLYCVIQSSDLPEVTVNVMASSRVLLRGFVRKAVEARELSATVAVGAFSDVVMRAISSVTLVWLAENWPAARFEREMALTVRLIVASVARPDLRGVLTAEIAACHAALEPGGAPAESESSGGSAPPDESERSP
jgi:AcrR family transcriptional regulator